MPAQLLVHAADSKRISTFFPRPFRAASAVSSSCILGSGTRSISASPTASFSSPSFTPSAGIRRYAILGGGFAGVSVAWHLLQFLSENLHIHVELYDELGIGGGASGVSGGLLHPYTPKGKLAWNGVEGWTCALNLLAVAEATYSTLESETKSQIAWRSGIIRPPASQRHCNDFLKHVKHAPGEHQRIAGLSCIDGALANMLVPGLVITPSSAALLISEGLNINPMHYLKALWRACELHGKQGFSKGSSCSYAILKKQRIESLSCLAAHYDAVIVCLGAGVINLPELSDKLPITLCRGVVVQLELPSGKEERHNYQGPSIVGDTWLAAQGPHKLMLGATKEWDSTTMTSEVADVEALAAYNEMVAKTTAFYPPIRNWCMQGARAGLRAMTPRTPCGKVPLVGCIDEIVNDSLCRRGSSLRYWILGGLGSRGLIHHGWLGKKLAEAVVSQSEACLPGEVLQWKSERHLMQKVAC